MPKQKRLYYYLLVALVALILADGTITRFLIVRDMATESNPFLEAWVGSDMLILLKLTGALLSAFILWLVFKREPKISLVITSFFVLFYTAIIFWNLFVYFMVRGL